jgi:hypothetical protein
MKKLISLAVLTMAFSQASFAERLTVSKVVSKGEHKVVIRLDETTVRCSSLGYGRTELKISVPQLEWIAIFDHSNIGESVPCMTAGQCEQIFSNGDVLPGLRPSDIIRSSEPRGETSIEVTLTEHLMIDTEKKTCTRSLEEDLKADLRRQNFTHSRIKFIREYPFEICMQRS